MNGETDTWLRDALPRGTVLHGYEIVGILGRGGFGITYKAVDRIDQIFAIKECYPKQVAVRHGTEVVPAGDQDEELFATCLDRFTREARALTLFSKSEAAGDGVVKVITFFETNRTAYIVMEFLEGESLDDIISAHPGGLPEHKLLPMMRSVLNSLSCVHDSGLQHRDIKPGNILVRPNGRPVLLDFGAVRSLQSVNPAASVAIFTEAYAPIEQIAGLPQGAFSDLYSFGMTCYKAIAGARFRGTPTSTERAARSAHGSDPIIPAVTLGAGHYNPALLEAIDLLIRVKPEERPQDVRGFLPHLDRAGALDAGLQAYDLDRTRVIAPAPKSAEENSHRTRPGREPSATDLPANAPKAKSAGDAMPVENPPVPAAPKSRRPLFIMGSTLTILVIAATGGYIYLRSADYFGSASSAAQDQPADPSSDPSEARPTALPAADLPSSSDLAEANAAYEQKDYQTALKGYLSAAGSNNSQAQYQLGYMYQLGQGVAQDYTAAVRWYTLAAGQGLKEAQLQLGYLAQNGLGTQKNYDTALHWYRLAATQGSAPAQNQLGYLYQMGYGVKVNYAEALKWYKSAAEQGSVPAEFRIGHFYAEGLGVARDLGTARDWMVRAAAGGNRDAKAWLAKH